MCDVFFILLFINVFKTDILTCRDGERQNGDVSYMYISNVHVQFV